MFHCSLRGEEGFGASPRRGEAFFEERGRKGKVTFFWSGEGNSNILPTVAKGEGRGGKKDGRRTQRRAMCHQKGFSEGEEGNRLEKDEMILQERSKEKVVRIYTAKLGRRGFRGVSL